MSTVVQIKLAVGRQQFLESLSWQGGGADRWIYPPWRPNQDRDAKWDENVELNTLIAILNSLKPLCSVAEFNSLCLFLTLERLEDHPEYSQWSVAAGRYQCAVLLLKLTLEVFQLPTNASIEGYKASLSRLVGVAVEDVVGRDVQQTLPLERVARDNGDFAARLDRLNLVSKLSEKSKPSRVVWSNKVKVQARCLTSTQATSIPRDAVAKASSRPSSAQHSGIVTRQNLDLAAPQMKSSMEFSSTVAWPSAGDKAVDRPLRSSEDDPFESSRSLAQSTAASSRPTTQQRSEGKKAMSWTVDVSDGGAGSAPSTGGSRKSLHSRDSHFGRRGAEQEAFSLNQHSVADTVASSGKTPVITPRPSGREAAEQERPVAARSSASKAPGLASPYSSHDVSAVSEVKSPSRSRSSASPSPSKRSARGASSSSSGDPYALRQSTRKGVLWDESCPLRCVSVLDENQSDGSATIAVGTNAKAVHVLQFRPRDLDQLYDETFRGADIADADGIVQDLTSHVQHIYTFEKVHNGSVYSMDYHHGSATLVTASNDKAVRIIKPNSRQLGAAMKGHTGTIRVVKFAPESYGGSSSVVAASGGAGDFRPRLWDVATESCQRILTEHKSTIHGLVWLNDQVLVTGCEDGVLTAHDVRDRHAIWSYSLSELLQQTPGGRDPVARSVCALEHVPLLTTPFAKPPPGAFVPPAIGGVLAVGCLNGSLSFLQTDVVPARVLVDQPAAHSADVRTVLALPDYHGGQRLHPLVFSASYDSTASLWACTPAQRRVDPVLQLSSQATLRAGHTDKVLCAAALHSNASIVTSGADGRVVLWNLAQTL